MGAADVDTHIYIYIFYIGRYTKIYTCIERETEREREREREIYIPGWAVSIGSFGLAACTTAAADDDGHGVAVVGDLMHKNTRPLYEPWCLFSGNH